MIKRYSALSHPLLRMVAHQSGKYVLFSDHVAAIEVLATQEQAKRIEELEKSLRWEQNRAGRIGTHGHDCHLWGYQHYECLLREFKELQVAMTIAHDIIDTEPKPQQVEQSQFLSDVMTAAGLLRHGKTDKVLAQRIADAAARKMRNAGEQSHAQVRDAALREAMMKCFSTPVVAMEGMEQQGRDRTRRAIHEAIGKLQSQPALSDALDAKDAT